MASRLDFHNVLEKTLGNTNVYFQTPKNIQLNYPCIIYKLNDIDDKKADNTSYIKRKSYQVTLIHKDPDNEIQDKILELPYCKFNNYFSSDNLHHYVYTIFF